MSHQPSLRLGQAHDKVTLYSKFLLSVNYLCIELLRSKVFRKRRQCIIHIAIDTISKQICLIHHGRQIIKERAHSSLGLLRWLLQRWLP